MKKPPIPANEDKRLAALRRLEILDTPPEERFERIGRVARRLFNVPIALITLVDASRQWFKCRLGFALGETSRDISFCAHAICGDAAMVVNDASLDARFADNPLVAGDPRIRFYAGFPIAAGDGSKIGTVCVLDSKPRAFTGDDVQSLADLAAWVEVEIRAVRLHRKQETLIQERAELRDRATTDPLTRVWNRGTIMETLEHELTRALREDASLSVIMSDIDHFKKINDTHGHQAGDAVLREVAKRLKSTLRPYDSVGRYGGEEFMIILPGADLSAAARTAERIRATVAGSDIPIGGKRLNATVSLGVSSKEFPERVKAEQLVKTADAALYRAKKNGRNRVELTE